MSEPLTSHEIEDVLSSIRRLVSDELRPIARTPAPAQPASALLLTPALRIVPESNEEIVEEDVASVAPAADDILSDPAENAVEAEPDWNMAPPTQDYDDQHPADEISFPPPDGVTSVELAFSSAADTDWTEVSDVLWSSAGMPDAEAFEAGSFDDRAQVEGERSLIPEMPTDHLPKQAVPDASWIEVEDEWQEQQPVSFVAHPRKPALAADPLARAWADKAEAEVRAGLGETLVPPAKEPLRTAAPPPEPPRAAAAPEPGLFDGSDPELDEESLREIVRDIIREELSGALGERITRNVRKLVRVEINRALTAREFE